MPSRTTSEFTLDPPEAERLANLSGPFDGHLRMIELRLGVEIANRGKMFPSAEAPALSLYGAHPLEQAGIASRM